MAIESNAVTAILLRRSRRSNAQVPNQSMEVIGMDAELSRRFRNVPASTFQGGTYDSLFGLFNSLMVHGRVNFGWHFLFKQVLVEILREHIVTGTEYDCPLNSVFEFSNVSRPIVMNQPGARLRRDAFHRPPTHLAEPKSKITGQQWDVLAPFAQRWHPDRDYLQPEI